jgi:antitoxin (DNA-binding transcriptional repressor) of toxin-antitoxin stability system
MALVNVHQAKTHLSQLLQEVEVEQGQEVVIARSGVPIARLVAWQAPAQPVAAPGAMRGQIQLADDFDAPLDELIEALRRFVVFDSSGKRNLCAIRLAEKYEGPV